MKTTNKIYVTDFCWDAEEQKTGEIVFDVGGDWGMAFGRVDEDLNEHWIEIEFNPSLHDKPGLFKENPANEKKLIPSWYCRYEAYGQIISINPLIVDCGELVISLENFDIKTIAELNSEEQLKKHISFEISRLDIREYTILSKPADRQLYAPLNFSISTEIGSTGILNDRSAPINQDETEITDETWEELQKLVLDYEIFVPYDYETIAKHKDKIPELEARGLAILKKIRKEWPVDRKTGRKININY